jgi:hypothetical protein
MTDALFEMLPMTGDQNIISPASDAGPLNAEVAGRRCARSLR